ncbi:uncharacterized protein LOC109602534 isoform X2 [Aethina tumida]|uniref:uncharacterized protein LOC109602534 isoform X2 n=1 Tax=Aethina tumida TaxID=116153 RepID=UPI00096AE22D|nr:uncharacterized protein LOC109602534 isoform X2 [Aethina tumida]
MNYLYGTVQTLSRLIFKRKPESPPEQREISRFEYYAEVVTDLLAWKDVAVTLQFFVGFHFVFWYILYLELKFLGVIFLALLVYFVIDSVMEYKYSNQILRPYSEDCYNFDITELMRGILEHRKDRPLSFCIMTVFALFLVNSAAYRLTQALFLYIVFLCTFLGPLIWKHLPEDVKTALKDNLGRFQSQAAVLAEEELIPFISEERGDNRDPDRDSLLTDGTQDSLTNSLTTGISAMPSHLDVNDDASRTPSFTPTKGLSSDSESESDSNKEIYFHSKHFNGSSSSEDDLYKQKGAQFSQEVLDAARGEGFSGLLQLGSNLVSSVMTRALPQQPVRRTASSSSESDFEIIEGDFEDKS